MWSMRAIAAKTVHFFGPPKLRLHPAKAGASTTPQPRDAQPTGASPTLRLVAGAVPEMPPVLVAGPDAASRAAVLHDLAETMRPSTVFTEADAFWEVLVRAPSSSMVILSGELDELPPESLMQMLAHRHPGLPVVSIDSSAAGVGAQAHS
jgi:hypothetical protein